MQTENNSEHSNGAQPRDDKREILIALFHALSDRCRDEALIRMSDHLNALRHIPAEEVASACEVLRDTWTNTFAAPQPGHIQTLARRFHAKNRAERRGEVDRQLMDHAEQNQITPARAQAELDRIRDIPLPEDDFERRVETKRRSGLEQYVAFQAAKAKPGGLESLMAGGGWIVRTGQGGP